MIDKENKKGVEDDRSRREGQRFTLVYIMKVHNYSAERSETLNKA